jgi:hypothetical protein
MIIPRIDAAEAASAIDPPVRGPWEFESPVCAGVGIFAYYLEEDEKLERERSAYDQHHYDAVLLCKRCPHLLECLSWGTYREPYGIWGGTTPSQRREIRQHKGVSINTPQSMFLYSDKIR